MKHLIWTSLLLLTTFTQTAADVRPQDFNELESHARKILDAKNGTVKKWATAPTFAIVSEHPISSKVQRVVDLIGNLSGLEVPPVKSITLSDLEISEAQEALDFSIKGIGAGSTYGALRIGSSSPIDVSANIYIFSVPNALASRLMIATHFGTGNTHLEKMYFKSKYNCFFKFYSNRKSILVGFIFINPHLNDESLNRCLYEEVFQVMGLPNDAEGSEYFTFDNSMHEQRTDLDFALIRALYDFSVSNGDSVDKVIEIFLNSLTQ